MRRHAPVRFTVVILSPIGYNKRQNHANIACGRFIVPKLK
jgi:hypothetical protein